MGETPLLLSIHPKGSHRCQDHGQPHTPLGLYYFSSSSAHWNTPPAKFEPTTFLSGDRYYTMLPPVGDLCGCERYMWMLLWHYTRNSHLIRRRIDASTLGPNLDSPLHQYLYMVRQCLLVVIEMILL